MKSSRPINKVLDDASDELAILVTRTRRLRRLTRVLRKQLDDDDLAQHCYIGNIENQTLVILADSAAWASKLRFYTANLLHSLPESDPAFEQIQVIKTKVLHQPTEFTEPTNTEHTGPQMNDENARGLRTLAENVDDPQLQGALTRLAKRAGKGKKPE